MKTEIRTRLVFVCICFSLIVFLAFSTEAFGEEPTLSKGQTLWVPVYSHFTTGVVPQQDVFSTEIKMKEVNRQLTTNVAIHNTDLNHPITIVKADYYDANGKLLKSFVSGPLKIKPIAAKYVIWDVHKYINNL